MDCVSFGGFCLFLARQTPLVQGLLIHEVSRSHTTTRHSRQDSSGRVISSSQRPVPDNTHNTNNRLTSMPPVGFEPTISAGERPQTYALERADTGTGVVRLVVTWIQVWWQNLRFWTPGGNFQRLLLVSQSRVACLRIWRHELSASVYAVLRLLVTLNEYRFRKKNRYVQSALRFKSSVFYVNVLFVHFVTISWRSSTYLPKQS